MRLSFPVRGIPTPDFACAPVRHVRARCLPRFRRFKRMDSGTFVAHVERGELMIRSGTLADLRRFYGGGRDFLQYHTMRILVAEIDGEVVGIGGYYFDADGKRIAFSDMWPKLRRRKKDVVR